jgi:hypothetical protein
MNVPTAICWLLVATCLHHSLARKASQSESSELEVQGKTRLRGSKSQEKESAATTWRCTGEGDSRSCLFKNLYYQWMPAFGKGEFQMLLKKGTELQNVQVKRADKYEGFWSPQAVFFEDEKEIQDYVASRALLDQPGLSLAFNPLFHHNIGHALFDGLYPAYMALVRLGLQDKDFRPVVGVDPGCFDGHAPDGELKVGDVVLAYLPDPRYNKTLQPVKVELLQVNQESSPSAEDTSQMRCNFEKGLDSSAQDLGAQPVHGGEAGKSQCCSLCEKTWGCSSGVIFGNMCYLKGACLKGSCDHYADERMMCRFHEERRPKVELSVRPFVPNSDKPGPEAVVAAQVQSSTIPGHWVVGKDRLRCMSEGIYETFGKKDSILRLFEMDRDLQANQNILFRFEEIAIGSGGAGNLIADQSGAIGGSAAPTDAMRSFRDRMLDAHGLPARKDTSLLSTGAQKPLDVLIISNKRFDADDNHEINAAIDAFRQPGKVNVELIDWGAIGTPKNRFHEHLKRVQDADVYVSSIGTALQYVPFMQDQKVYIALGTVWQRSNQLFPTFMEQQLAGGGTPYLRTLYADPGAALRTSVKHPLIGEDGYRAHVNGAILLKLLGEAKSLVETGFKTPVPIKDNLSKEGQVLLELCEQDPASCKRMNADRNGATYECAVVLWPECVVYEAGPWRNKCNLNRNLLRKLRKKHGLFSYGAPEM